MYTWLRRLLIGRPLHNREASEEKLPKWKALATFSSDALSSVAYGPEQIMLMLAVPGLLAYGYMAPVALAILVLLAIVTFSYVQVSRANPGGGGSYAVAGRHLGELPALTAAAALFADYVLTVAVSVSAGTAAITSAFPALLDHTVAIDLAVLFAVLMLINLRGVRESATVFVYPTYAFILGILALIAAGVFQALTGAAPAVPPESFARQPLDQALVFLILRAFANGCSSMTGVEAISNGVPMFRQPEVRNAAHTTYMMASLLAVMFAGTAFLIMHFHILPTEGATALSVTAEKVFGRGSMYYYIQITTMLVLYLAANTAYNGLPPLMSILARDGYMPRYLGTRGERLSFSNGIVLLSMIAAALIVIYRGDTEHLISLYAIGVFLSFTIAQSGLVVHWYEEKGRHWQARVLLNAVGAVITGGVVLIIAVTKFAYGAWIVLIFIPAAIRVFRAIRDHYRNVADQFHLDPQYFKETMAIPRAKNLVLLPIASPTRAITVTLRYARAISDAVIVLHVATDDDDARLVEEKWRSLDPDLCLITIRSPFRLVIRPILDFVTELEIQRMEYDFITVLIPEFQPKKWWHRLLYNQTALILRSRLILQAKHVVVTTLPYHLTK